MATRKEQYEKKREDLIKVCTKCRKENRIFPPTIERCESCSTGKRLRWLEAEYSDVTGFFTQTLVSWNL